MPKTMDSNKSCVFSYTYITMIKFNFCIGHNKGVTTVIIYNYIII